MQPLLIYKNEQVAPLIHLRRGEQKIGERYALGIEVDMDSMIDMPSSALTPTGFRVEEVRRFVGFINSAFGAVYLHLAEGAPVIHTNDMIKVGKTLAYLVLDFVKTAGRESDS
jgi:hypothetical protein